MRKDTYHWSRTAQHARVEHKQRSGVYEAGQTRLKLTTGEIMPPLTAWHGRSGRRYIFGIHTVLGLPALIEAQVDAAVLLAVHRPRAGEVEILDVRDAVPGQVQSWLSAVFTAGANELHVHRLAEGAAARAAVVADLQAEPAASQVAGEPEPDAVA